ncbi:MAG: hypothetical protein ACYTF7_00090 [Planctomycetota bacterium]|jgi:hypothetical protein
MNTTHTQLEDRLRQTSSSQLRQPSASMRERVMRQIDSSTESTASTSLSVLGWIGSHRARAALALAACLAVVSASLLVLTPSAAEPDPTRSPEMITSLIESTKSSVESAPPLQAIATRAVFGPYQAEGQAILDDAQRVYAVLEKAVRPLARVISVGGGGAPTGF